MTRTDIINYLIRKNRYTRYLEIGVAGKKANFDLIECGYKVGVDPEPTTEADYITTSDDFFSWNKRKFDIVFIDGLHVRDQFVRDVENSLAVLAENGTIVCHDCLPVTFANQDVTYPFGAWTGDVWKGVFDLRTTRKDLSIDVVDTDWGCGVIRKGSQELYVPEEGHTLDFAYFLKHRNPMLNVISINDFLKKY